MDKIIKKATLAEQAYDQIKGMIVTGKLAPGEELPEGKLALELGISRTPLREALRKLAADALIDLRSTRPAVVALFTSQDVKEIMELRKLLELHCLDRLPKADRWQLLFELKRNAAQQAEAIEENDLAYFMNKDQQFHALLTNTTPNKRMKEIIAAINTGGSRALLLLSETLATSAAEAYQEHLGIIDAIEQDDIGLAKQQLAAHLENIENRLLNYYINQEVL
ncbi:GntR family transcriptional regulator [Planomicrobium sp. CPCC 101079]|uniref:GntR family transcriptional regulator n=1 Tax=Planomicrobium sp. CPCC 101079 TaxID=2599618 RepID=UPI0011B52787|nr:GntR family transcriptional regulator [Planomicrobium sp. CPCC 101079]TWT01836.1 GntR family transcriptional regulator [Planomicrobium sp. CPCC 101079]